MRSPFVLALAAAPAPALAQEAMYTQAATMPSPHTAVLRSQVHYARYSSQPDQGIESTDNITLDTSIAYGLARGLALNLDVPVEFEKTNRTNGDDKNDYGVGDLSAMLKWRFYQDDSGGINTVRAALLGGAHFASGDDSDFSSGSFNPMFGAVLTAVRGRHGFNQDLIYKWNTGKSDIDNTGGGRGPADAVLHGSAYVYRIAPASFAKDSKGAWYVTAELNGIYETNGDYELEFAPGLMYEGWEFAFETMLQLPVYARLDERAAQSFAVGFGFRFSF